MTKQTVKGYGCQTRRQVQAPGRGGWTLDVVPQEFMLYSWHNGHCECLRPRTTPETPTGSRCPLDSRESVPPASPFIFTEFLSWKPSFTNSLLELHQF